MIDLWTRLQNSGKPIVMYGMGNGADKIADELERRGMRVSAYFASDGFVRGQIFRGLRVMTFDEVKRLYSDFIILVSFASQLPDVMARINALDETYEVYAPDVPVVGGRVFDKEYYRENEEAIRQVRSMFADEESTNIYDNIVRYKLTGELKYLRAATCDKVDVLQSVLRPQRYQVCADLGAYNGDSVREFVACFPNLTRVISLEPDRRNFKKLCRYTEEAGLSFVECHNCAAWSHDGETAFSQSGNRNSRAGEGGGLVTVRALDHILQGERVDYIKYDVEGSELEALKGSLESIRRYAPDLLVSLYHRNEDIFALPLFLHSVAPEYRFFLRRFPYIPAWDLNLYAISSQ